MAILDLSGSISAVSSVSGNIDSEYIAAVNSTDDPLFRTHNLKWLENSPSDGFVRWESLDGINPILILFGNEVYEITPAQTAFTHIFWRLESPNNIVASNDEPDINSEDVFPLIKNTAGIVDAAWGVRIIDTQKIAANAISAEISEYSIDVVDVVGEGEGTVLCGPLTLTTTGGAVKLTVTAFYGAVVDDDFWCFFREDGGAIEVTTESVWAEADWGASMTYTKIYRYTPAPGTYEYIVLGFSTGQDAWVGHRFFSVEEIKK